MNQRYSIKIPSILRLAVTISLTFWGFSNAYAQSYKDSTQRKHVIKYDLTGTALYQNAFNFTYERVIKKNRTLGITLGYQELPSLGSLIGSEMIGLERKTGSGFKVAVDYRFYLAKENRYQAPHGVFIGPYIANHNFNNSWDVVIRGNSGPQTGTIDGKFNILNVGFQTGYQFLINNRWSIDMSFIGASYSHYRAVLDVNGDFDLGDTEISQELIEAISDKFPLLGDLIDDGNVDQSGKLNSWGFGLRYIVNVGYAFGGGNTKKKPKTIQP
jgi:hypothetical protein